MVRGVGDWAMVKSNKSLEYTQKPLPPLLDEFRTALQDEIEAARRNASSSAIPLTDGHKVDQQGSAFQYAFLIDSVLNAPDGAPGDLIVPGKAPMAVTIVSVKGLRLLISVETDLGDFVPTAKLQSDLTILMRRLVERIENNASSNNPAASRMLGTSPVSGSPVAPASTPKLKLNEGQTCALESALGRNLTVIWGPPGTGKTRTIGAVAHSLHDSKRTVLIVSHTNTAVDQAIKHVARAMPEYLEQGAVVRIGVVSDDQLRHDHSDVLLETQVKRQSRALVELRDNLKSQRNALGEEESSIRRRISIVEWVEESRSVIASSSTSIERLHDHEKQLASNKRKISELEDRHAELVGMSERALHVLKLREDIVGRVKVISYFESQLAQNSLEREKADRSIQEQESRIKTARRIASLRDERATYPSTPEQGSIIGTLSATIVERSDQIREARASLSGATSILEQVRNTGAAARLWRRLPRPQEQETVVSSLAKKVTALEAELTAAQAASDAATGKLGRIMELESELSRYEAIGTLSEELERKTQLEEVLPRLERRKIEIVSEIDKVRSAIQELGEEEAQCAAAFGGDVQRAYDQASLQLRQYEELHVAIEALNSEMEVLRKSISLALSPLVTQVLYWEEISDPPSAVEEKHHLVCETHQRLSAEYSTDDLSALKDKANSLRSDVLRLNAEIADIDKRLAQIERQVIANARVVGATLTKTYLSDDIQDRKFDTVILDEASMAPIPALWAAALLAENNLIIVGDFRQIPPIVISENKLTRHWLGRDIFEASGVKALYEKGSPPEYFIQLNEQRRMLPEIARVANLFYGDLRTPPDPPEGLDRFKRWCSANCLQKSPVTLVDTGSLNAWVTSVVKGGTSSRLNFLSATVAVDLAEQLLSPDRPGREEGAPDRVIIVSPYRPHFRLTKILLAENPKVLADVIAGTVHSFQGSEADVVIFDLVVDEPHFVRVNLFTPDLDEEIKRLLNVGLTRARFRLFVLGDFSYCQTHGKKAFLGRVLLPFLLKSFPRVDALELFPEGLAAKAARAQMTMLGGEIEPDSARLVLNQADFFRVLSADFSRARHRIIIYSPFMTENRLSFLMPQLHSACSRGVAVSVITKSRSERLKSEISQIRTMEDQLSKIGVVVMHKMRMHEKLVFIDDDISWVGSLNPLSYSNTQETMERRRSKAVLDDYFQTLRLNEFISVQGSAESKCPICGSEMVAAEGAKEPYYWRCVNGDCYTRGIDQPYPFDGMLRCDARDCDAPLEFGYWADYPHWRCTANRHHHQKMYKSHLRLRKMAELIPKSEQRKVYRILGIGEDQFHLLNGLLICTICNAPVQFAYWGDDPNWCCSQNPLHRRKMLKSDLRSHMMAELIPRSEQRKVCSILGIADLATYVSRAESGKPQQAKLFDDSK